MAWLSRRLTEHVAAFNVRQLHAQQVRQGRRDVAHIYATEIAARCNAWPGDEKR
jgi:hypothetical protein